MTTEMREPPITPTGPPARRPFLPWLLAGVLVLVVIGAAIGVLVARDDNPNRNGADIATAQLASIQQACAQWRNADTDSRAPSASWCTAMVGWMAAQTNGGHMTGAMMWSDPDGMRDTCLRWMATVPDVSDSTPGASEWCESMVGWMTQNGTWNPGGTLGGPMMGR